MNGDISTGMQLLAGFGGGATGMGIAWTAISIIFPITLWFTIIGIITLLIGVIMILTGAVLVLHSQSCGET